MSDLIKGLDVSVIQGNINWSAVAAAGYQFCVMRCGVGNNGIDSFYPKNIAGAKAAGLKVAAYHFIFPLPPLSGQPMRDPILQAQYHFKAVQDELAACDLEWPTPDQWQKWGCSAQQITDWSLSYLQEYERLSGRKPLIYTYPYFCQAIKLPVDFAAYPLWIASYKTATPFIPKPWTDWTLWQWDDGSQTLLPGSGVKVDADRAKDLSLWDAPVAPVSEPIPDHQPEPVPVPVAVVQPDPPSPVVAPPAPTPVAPSYQTASLASVWNLIVSLINKLLGKK